MTDDPERVLLPEHALMSYAEVLNWIAFRQASEDNIVGACDRGILHVLEAMAVGGRLWESTPTPPGTPEWAIVDLPSPGVAEDIDRAHALLQSDGRSPAEHATEMRQNVEAWKKREEKWLAAVGALVDAHTSGGLTVHDSFDAGHYEGRCSPGLWIRNFVGRMPDGWFSTEEIVQRWPSPAIVEEAEPAEIIASSSPPTDTKSL